MFLLFSAYCLQLHLYTHWDLHTVKAQNKFSFPSWSKKPRANRIVPIFHECGKRYVTRRFVSEISPFIALQSSFRPSVVISPFSRHFVLQSSFRPSVVISSFSRHFALQSSLSLHPQLNKRNVIIDMLPPWVPQNPFIPKIFLSLKYLIHPTII